MRFNLKATALAAAIAVAATGVIAAPAQAASVTLTFGDWGDMGSTILEA
jgi:Spy/CpxP family protein refolding chaperone